MAEISRITLPSGTTYDLKDTIARQQIAGGVQFRGVSTTAITDGGSQKPTIGGTEITPANGDLVIYNNSEFIFSGTYGSGGAWAEFGDMSTLGSLAYKNSASGTVAVPKTYTTTVTPSSVTKYVATSTTGGGSATKERVAVGEASGTVTYTPSGTISQPTFTGDSMEAEGTFTPDGTVTVTTAATSNKTATVSAAAGAVTYSPGGTISVGTGTANYTPEGTISTPTITVTPSTVSKYVATSATGGGSVTAGTKASFTATVSGETLTLGFTQNTPTAVTLPSFSSQTIATGISSASSSQPTFSGTGKELKFNGTGVRLVTGNIPVPASYSATFKGSEGDISVTGTPSGTVSAPTFTGTGARLITVSDVYTSVTMPSFSSQTIATGISSASTTTATTESKTVTVS